MSETKTRSGDTHNPRSASPLDQHIGERVRLGRQIAGITQEQLAERLGLTFQQVQKYERGANRISAARLLAVADMVGQPLSFFYETFDSAPSVQKGPSEAIKLDLYPELNPQQARDVMAALNRCNPKLRTKLVGLIRAIDAAN